MAIAWDKDSCNEKSGFLFSHECFKAPVATCDLCQKPVCAEHVHMFGSSDRICTSCAKKRDRGRTGMKEDQSKGIGRSTHDDYDRGAYFYSGHYFGSSYYDSYHGGGMNDPNDFTEADAASLSSEMDEGFENDMSES